MNCTECVIDNRDGDGKMYVGLKWENGLITFKRDEYNKPVPIQRELTGPKCEQCGEPFSMAHDCTRGDHHYTAGPNGEKIPTAYKPQSKVGQYISCQYCYKPAGDHQTKVQGICYDCKQKMVDEGHAREAEQPGD